jgi:general secretion pathway protein A
VLPEEGLDAPGSNRWWRWLAAAVAAVFVVAFVIGYWRAAPPEIVPAGNVAGNSGRARDTAGVVAGGDGVTPRESVQASTLAGEDVSGMPVSGGTQRAASVMTVDTARLAVAGGEVLKQRLTAASPVVAAKAWSGLDSLWGMQSSAVNDAQACATAPAVGLRCLQGGGSRTVLQYYDRPAVLLLVSPGGRRVPVLLQEIRGSHALLQVDGRPVDVPLETMERHWFGEYRLLWKTPPGGSAVLRPGDRSSDVQWLREKLKQATGLASIAPDPLFYDEGLKTLVQEFQRSRELSADGVVGARTFIHLNNLSRQPTVPRLGTGTVQ